MSGTPVFSGSSSEAEFVNEIPVSAPTTNETCEFESLIPGQDKTLSTEETALTSSVLLVSFISESI